MSMYVRLKRKNQTVFMHVEPSDNFASIKARLAELFSTEPSGIMLLNKDKRELVDMGSISDQEITTNEIIFMLFKKPGSDQWEELRVDLPTPLTDSAGAEESQQAP